MVDGSTTPTLQTANRRGPAERRDSSFGDLSEVWVALSSAGGLAAFAKVLIEVTRARRTSLEIDVNGRTFKIDGRARDVHKLVEKLAELLDDETGS